MGTKVLFAGGCLNDSCSRLSKVVDIYDTATGAWTTATLSEGRDNLAATRIGSKVFLAYGPGAVVEIYDDSTGAWSTAPLSLERVGLVATSVGSKAFFAGGQIGKYRADSGRVDIYDASTDTWSTAKLSRTGGAHLAAGTIGTKAFFADGPSGIVEIYDDSTGTWDTAILSQQRHGLAMTIVGTKAFFAGGHDLSHYSDVVDVYDASTGDWTTTTLSEGRLMPVAGSAGHRRRGRRGQCGQKYQRRGGHVRIPLRMPGPMPARTSGVSSATSAGVELTPGYSGKLLLPGGACQRSGAAGCSAAAQASSTFRSV